MHERLFCFPAKSRLIDAGSGSRNCCHQPQNIMCMLVSIFACLTGWPHAQEIRAPSHECLCCHAWVLLDYWQMQMAVVPQSLFQGHFKCMINLELARMQVRAGTAVGHGSRPSAQGLKVICTSLQPSRRLDLQLRGRAGRQGDPGETHMLLDLDDPNMDGFAAPFKDLFGSTCKCPQPQ